MFSINTATVCQTVRLTLTAELMKFSKPSQSFHGATPRSGTATTSQKVTTATEKLRSSAQLRAGHTTAAAVTLPLLKKLKTDKLLSQTLLGAEVTSIFPMQAPPTPMQAAQAGGTSKAIYT